MIIESQYLATAHYSIQNTLHHKTDIARKIKNITSSYKSHQDITNTILLCVSQQDTVTSPVMKEQRQTYAKLI